MTSAEPATLASTHRHRLRSAAIGEIFQIDVALPPGWSPGGPPLPVVYVMDGNAVFGIAAQALRQLQSAREARPAIVVGVGYCLDGVARPANAHGSLRTRDLTPSHDQGSLDNIAAGRGGRPAPVEIEPTGGAARFRDFLIDELRPFLAGLYAGDPDEQILVGSSLGGLFSLFVLMTRPGAFQRHVAGSPSLWWDNCRLFSHLEDFARAGPGATREVFLSAGGLETQAPWLIADNMRRFTAALQTLDLPGLKVTSHVFADETHASVIPAALSRGLRTVLAPG